MLLRSGLGRSSDCKNAGQDGRQGELLEHGRISLLLTLTPFGVVSIFSLRLEGDNQPDVPRRSAQSTACRRKNPYSEAPWASRTGVTDGGPWSWYLSIPAADKRT